MPKPRTTVKILVSLFLALSLVIAAAGVILGYVNAARHADDPQVEAVITHFASGEALVRYTYRGETYENVTLNAWSSSWYEGKTLTVRPDLHHPGKATVPLDWLVPVILLTVSGVFCLVSIILAIVLDPWDRKRRRLMEQGHRIYAFVDGAEPNPHITVNGRHPWVLYCHSQDMVGRAGKEFVSESLWEDPRNIYPTGSAVPVYVDVNHPKKYYVDVRSRLERK